MPFWNSSRKAWNLRAITFFSVVCWGLIYHSLSSCGWDFTFFFCCSETIQAHISGPPESCGVEILSRDDYQDSYYSSEGNHHASQSCEVESLKALLIQLGHQTSTGTFSIILWSPEEMPQDIKHVNTMLFKKKCEKLALVNKMATLYQWMTQYGPGSLTLVPHYLSREQRGKKGAGS